MNVVINFNYASASYVICIDNFVYDGYYRNSFKTEVLEQLQMKNAPKRGFGLKYEIMVST